MRLVAPANKGIYHIFNRGNRKRNIFNSKKDYERFIVNLILFNTKEKSVRNISRYDVEGANKKIPKDPLVKIHAFSLMPNHFHLMLEQVEDKGIANFMHSIEMGYAHYFNKFYSKSGHLFQGTYKLVHVKDNGQFLYLPLYIHLNALELLNSEKDWKTKGVKNIKNSINFLKKYPWSSLGEYLGVNSFPFIYKDLLNDSHGDLRELKEILEEWSPKDEVDSLNYNFFE